MTTESLVIEILARQSGTPPEAVGPETSIASLGLDSLGVVEVVFALEETFGVSIPFNMNTPDAGDIDFSTVSGIIRGIETLAPRHVA